MVSEELHLQRLGKYELQEPLSRGALGETWKAFDPQSQSYVAIRLLREELRDDPEFMERFWSLPLDQEALTIIFLRHPNIVHIHGFHISSSLASEAPLPYIVMDYIEGPSLDDYLRSKSTSGDPLTSADIIYLAASLASAIDYAHEQDIIHGNIKPTAILLNQHDTAEHSIGRPMLADTGISRLLGIFPLPNRGVEAHSASSFSPEQAQSRPAGRESDIYALGVILYELLSGTQPFRGSDWDARRMQTTDVPPSPLYLDRGEISPAASAVIMRSLAKEPEDPFPNAASLVEALAEALDVAVPETASEPFSPEEATNAKGTRDPVTHPVAESTAETSPPPDLTILPSTFAIGEEAAPSPDTVQPEIETTIVLDKRRRASFVINGKARPLFFAILLLLMLGLTTLGIFLYARHSRPSVVAPVLRGTLTPRAKATSSPPVTASLYPPLAPSYAGTISDIGAANTTTKLYLAQIQQNQKSISGRFTGLGLVGPFSGTVTSSGGVHFTVSLASGLLIFDGNIKVGGDLAGSFTMVDQQGISLGEYGPWYASATS